MKKYVFDENGYLVEQEDEAFFQSRIPGKDAKASADAHNNLLSLLAVAALFVLLQAGICAWMLGLQPGWLGGGIVALWLVNIGLCCRGMTREKKTESIDHIGKAVAKWILG